MKRLRLSHCALSICVAAILPTGCGGTQIAGLGTTPPDVNAARHTTYRSGSWMKPASSNSDLLYVSNYETDSGPGNVYVYLYPDGSLVGTLTGFQNPQSICTNKSGDVFIPDASAADVVEYAHGGMSPIKTLSDSGEPSACSVDPTTGNLAVSNLKSFVSIYKKSRGTPKNYSTPLPTDFCGYDNAGNLFADGYDYDRSPNEIVVWKLFKGGASFKDVNLPSGLKLNNKFPVGFQWVGKDLTFAHANPPQYGCCGHIFRFTIQGTDATKVGGTTVSKVSNFFVKGSTVIVATGGEYVDLYDYPKSRNQPKVEIKEPAYSSFGVTVSDAHPAK